MKMLTAEERPNSKYAIHFEEETMTKQSFKETCDINNIMKKYQATGVVDHIAKHEGQYQDLNGDTYTEMQYQIAKARNMFEELPAAARKYFKNDPAQFLDFVDNADGASDLLTLAKLGLTDKSIAELGVTEGKLKDAPEGDPNNKLPKETTEKDPE